MKVKPHKKFEGLFLIDSKLATINLTPGYNVYGEELIKIKNIEYRIWDFWRSKPAAAIKKGLKNLPIKKGFKILYLGIASGTTVSHFSDIIGKEGVIYGIDVAERALRELIPHAERRGNIIPILADARIPENYEKNVIEKVDLVYCDVASPDQAQLLVWNSKKFLKSDGWAIISIKSQSIDVTKPPKEVYEKCLEEFEKYFEIVDKVELDPYEKAHMFVVMKKK